ncbi:MAG: hypothetical protein GTN36_02390, partial [Candidatus Aenigmarchaeota archaeon]|nr:hypothetical protein [Candidatus Aenigmarchaeota archaeon]
RIYSQSMGTSWTSPSINIREGREYYYEGGWQYFEMHYFELYWYEDETDSKIKAWFDGDLKIDETVDSLGSGDSIDEYRFGGVGVDGIGNPSFYIDCIAISNEYVGEECYPDDEPYFVFSLKSKGMETKTDFGYEEIYEGWYYYFTPFDGVLWFKFNEARGTTAYDSSPYGN